MGDLKKYRVRFIVKLRSSPVYEVEARSAEEAEEIATGMVEDGDYEDMLVFKAESNSYREEIEVADVREA